MERQRNERLCCLEGAWSIPEFYSVTDPREGPGGAGPSLIFRPNWSPKGGKYFFRTPFPPLSNGLDDRPPRPLTSRSGSGIVIYHPNSYNTSPMLSLFAVMAGQRQGGHKLEHILLSKYINSHDNNEKTLLTTMLTIKILFTINSL